MLFHVSLRYVYRQSHFATSFYSSYFAALGSSDQLWIINQHAISILENTEKLRASVVGDRSEHSDLLGVVSRL